MAYFGNVTFFDNLYTLQDMAVSKKTAIGNVSFINEPLKLEALSTSGKSANFGNVSFIDEPLKLETLSTSVKRANFGNMSFFDNVNITLEPFVPASFILKPDTITLGAKNLFTIYTEVLVTDPKVAADAYFSDVNNWKFVYMVYKSTGGQRQGIRFTIADGTLVGKFDPTATARSGDDWLIKGVIIVDHDSGYLIIRRNELTTDSFDLISVT